MDLISIVVLFIPLLLILWFANLADGQREKGQPGGVFALVTYFILGIIWTIVLLVGVLLSLFGFLIRSQAIPSSAVDSLTQMGVKPEGAQQLLQNLPPLGMAFWLPAVLGIVLLLPPVRRLIARLIAIDARSTVHAVALSYTMLIIINLWATVVFGLGNLADLSEMGGAVQPGDIIGLTWVQEILFVLLALIGVGLFARRGFRSTLVRLAIVRPTLRQVLLGIAIGIIMALALIPLDYLMKTTGIGWDKDVERLGEQFIGPLTRSLAGVITLGVAAALGEELVFRGALQPRFGLILTAVLFALLHSNYGITASTAIVLVIGLVLGLVRQRSNTTTSMFVHAFYNMSIGLLTYLSLWPQ